MHSRRPLIKHVAKQSAQQTESVTTVTTLRGIPLLPTSKRQKTQSRDPPTPFLATTALQLRCNPELSANSDGDNSEGYATDAHFGMAGIPLNALEPTVLLNHAATNSDSFNHLHSRVASVSVLRKNTQISIQQRLLGITLTGASKAAGRVAASDAVCSDSTSVAPSSPFTQTLYNPPNTIHLPSHTAPSCSCPWPRLNSMPPLHHAMYRKVPVARTSSVSSTASVGELQFEFAPVSSRRRH